MISPSLLSANFANLGADMQMLNQSRCQWVHVDVMDGLFVPNISFGQPIVKHIKKISSKPLDVHLMIMDPARYIDDFVKAGADLITVHYEACTHLDRTLHAIKDHNIKCGVALNPATPVSLLEDSIQLCDLVLLMSVNPGFGGQKFIENTYRKLEHLNALRNDRNPNCIIEIDGGVNANNAGELYRRGADLLVAGNAVFGAENPSAAIDKILAAK